MIEKYKQKEEYVLSKSIHIKKKVISDYTVKYTIIAVQVAPVELELREYDIVYDHAKIIKDCSYCLFNPFFRKYLIQEKYSNKQ